MGIFVLRKNKMMLVVFQLFTNSKLPLKATNLHIKAICHLNEGYRKLKRTIENETTTRIILREYFQVISFDIKLHMDTPIALVRHQSHRRM